jgi:hypothetical protein
VLRLAVRTNNQEQNSPGIVPIAGARPKDMSGFLRLSHQKAMDSLLKVYHQRPPRLSRSESSSSFKSLGGGFHIELQNTRMAAINRVNIIASISA